MKTLRASLIESDVILGRRSGPRWRVELLVSAGRPDALAEATVRNLSEGGLMLETETALEVGETIQVELPDAQPTQAEVVWAEGTSYGCAFVAPVSTAAISAALLRAPLAGPDYAMRAPEFREFVVGRNPSIDEVAQWKARFASSRDAEDFTIIAFSQRAGGTLIALAAPRSQGRTARQPN